MSTMVAERIAVEVRKPRKACRKEGVTDGCVASAVMRVPEEMGR